MDVDLVNKLILELQIKMGKEHRDYVQELEVIRAHINTPDEETQEEQSFPNPFYRLIT